jgi:hypothetical protein
MKHKRKPLTSLLSIPLAGALFHLKIDEAAAEEISFGIYPAVTELTARSGETVERALFVRNNTETPLSLTSLLQAFTSSDEENGEVRFLSETPDFFRYIKLYDQNEPVREFTLSPGEEKELLLRIAIPQNEKPGDYYFSLILLSQAEETERSDIENQISAGSTLSGGAASHVLLSINPAESRELSLSEFSGPAFSQSSPIPFKIRLANEGSNYLKAQGEITIRNAFGKKAAVSEIPATVILSHTTRSIPNESGNKEGQKTLLPGIYRATLSVNDTTMLNPIDKTIYFMVAPIEIVFLTAAVIISILFFRHRLKKRFSQ